ncbi:hypothetical protein ACTWPB_08780 [Nocardia sp. IBHARD005]|uniref:hypothetical protein n=1 Tax=Nocardia sp. IBHARD005 TaxID=3457765 RepID=UPI0040599A5F
MVRTVHEYQQTVLWNGTVGRTPLGRPVPDPLVVVPLVDKPPSNLVLEQRRAQPADPLDRRRCRDDLAAADRSFTGTESSGDR